MKRHTFKTTAGNIAGWQTYRVPRGRVIGLAVTNNYVNMGDAANPIMVCFNDNTIFPGISCDVSGAGEDSRMRYIDDECNGRVDVYTLINSMDAIITLFYADETDKFQIEA